MEAVLGSCVTYFSGVIFFIEIIINSNINININNLIIIVLHDSRCPALLTLPDTQRRVWETLGCAQCHEELQYLHAWGPSAEKLQVKK